MSPTQNTPALQASVAGHGRAESGDEKRHDALIYTLQKTTYNCQNVMFCEEKFGKFNGLYGNLRGRRSKGKGKGIRARDHARERREEGNACKQAIVFTIPPTN